MAAVSQLKLYEPPHLEESHPVIDLEATIPDFQPHLTKDTDVDVHNNSTR